MLLQAEYSLKLKTNQNKKHTPQPTYPTVHASCQSAQKSKSSQLPDAGKQKLLTCQDQFIHQYLL